MQSDPALSRSQACLAALAILQLVMLGALFSQTPPHPPAAVAPFAIAPMLAVSLSTVAAALIIGPLASMTGRLTTLCAIALAMVSFGPQKWFDPAIAQIWPAVLAAQITSAALAGLVLARRNTPLPASKGAERQSAAAIGS